MPRIIAETPRLILREFVFDDADALASIFGDPQVMQYGDGIRPVEQVREWLRSYIDDHYLNWGFGKWAVVHKARGEVIGYCGPTRFSECCNSPTEAEVGYRLAKVHWGQGFATEALRETCHHALNDCHLMRLIALVDPHNVASVRVIQKAGFHYERDVLLPGYSHPDQLHALERLSSQISPPEIT